jgi:tRNA-splicing ligase RtcB (3'-phosphate/5'-hydroxy nucleic acid ligase)
MPAPADIRRITDTLWEIPASEARGMRVPARIYADRQLLESMDDGVFEQVQNVAVLPGIVGWSICMPDGHWGYGFPIGGIAAFDPENGVISPGGIGFDVNCGMRLARTALSREEVEPKLRELVDGLYARIPAGVGAHGFLHLDEAEFLEIAETGSPWCVARGYGWPEDLELTESGGKMTGADSRTVSARAVERGLRQIGTLGSGNHYLEIQVVQDVVDQEAAKVYGVRRGQVCVMFHCGSRGFGHQVATDYILELSRAGEKKYHIHLPDKGLACAPFHSKEGERYFAAMNCAINVSYANRQMIMHGVREVFSEVFHRDPRELGLEMVYDVSHNTARLERHVVEGTMREVLVHRKGATRSLGPGSPEVPAAYRQVGQPVIIGGSMETGSWLLAGTGNGDCFATTAHGSGRTMSRGEAKRKFKGAELREHMMEKGIYVRAASLSGLAEEAGAAYKDIDRVVAVAEAAGISKRVAKLVPIGNVKG